jgi:hypothetical protein
MCCTITEQKVADIVFEHEDLYYVLEDIHTIMSKCLEFDRGTAFFVTSVKTSKEDAWYTIDLDDLKLSWEWSSEETVTRLIHDLIVSWGENVDEWESSDCPIDDMAESQRSYKN